MISLKPFIIFLLSAVLAFTPELAAPPPQPPPIQPPESERVEESRDLLAPFTIPEALNPQIEFWKKVFSEYETDQVIIHDNRYVNVIYDIVSLKSNYESRYRKKVSGIVGDYRSRLEKMAEYWDTPEQMTLEEKRIRRLFETIPDNPLYPQKDAFMRVRGQVGQANRFAEGIARSGRYLLMMEKILDDHGLPEGLKYLPMVESAFNSSAVSYAGASGMWQIMRGSGRDFGLTVGYPVDERNDPFRATQAAVKILEHNYSRLKAWPLAITAYNHGLYGVLNAVNDVGSSHIGDIVERYQGRNFGFASRNFYAEFLAAVSICSKYSEIFEFIEQESPLSFVSVMMPDYVASKALENYCDIPLDELRDLNPALHSSVLSSKGVIPGNYILRLSPEQAYRLVSKYESIPARYKYDKSQVKRNYRVRRGETLSHIAAKSGVSLRELMICNGIGNPRRLRAGQTIKIPSAYARAGRKQHKVRRGQTLSSIAQRYGVSIQDIKSANKIKSADKLRTGQVLRIPER